MQPQFWIGIASAVVAGLTAMAALIANQLKPLVVEVQALRKDVDRHEGIIEHLRTARGDAE